jgi:hypothetical protein
MWWIRETKASKHSNILLSRRKEDGWPNANVSILLFDSLISTSYFIRCAATAAGCLQYYIPELV